MATESYNFLLKKLSDLLVQIGIPVSEITPQARFLHDLGMDSLDSVDLMMRMEQEFSLAITDEQMSQLRTVEQAVQFLDGKLTSDYTGLTLTPPMNGSTT